MSEVKTLHLFQSNLQSHNFVFKNGTVAHFIRGVYTTDIESEIDELNAEIKARHPHIFIDPNRVTIAADELDPMSALKKKLKEEIRAEMEAAAGTTTRNMGSTAQAKDGGQVNSNTVAPVAAGAIKVGSK